MNVVCPFGFYVCPYGYSVSVWMLCVRCIYVICELKVLSNARKTSHAEHHDSVS